MQVGLNNPAEFLRALFDRAVAVADPMRVVAQYLPQRPEGRPFVIGAGKASARMAEAVEEAWGSCEGLVITRYGYARPTKRIEIIEAAHPVPDEAGRDATQKLLKRVENLSAKDHVLALISGGASALLCAPADGLSFAQKQDINAALLASGAPISQMNILRKSLSKVKGGRLAQAIAPAQLTSLLISDVPGDDPADIGSGPTAPSDPPVPLQTALALREKWLPAFPNLDAVIRNNPAPQRDARSRNIIIAAPSQSLKAAAKLAAEHGIESTILGDALEGEAREVAKAHAELALKAHTAKGAPHLFLSGGELTVTKRGQGVGGPNAEYALALALALNGAPDIYALAGDTDGVDGAVDRGEIAGAQIDPTTLQRGGRERAQTALENHDAHSFFQSMGDSIITGPTLTNVNDFRAVLVL